MSDLFSWAENQISETKAEEPLSSIDDVTAPQPLSVSELNRLLKETLESQFAQLLLEGEISNFKAHSSGHFYFSLKDEQSQINAAMFKGSNMRLRFQPRDGMKVLVRGNISLYTPRGQYQIIVTSMEPLGEGALRVAFEQLKEKLQREGLFDPKNKIPLPAFPQTIGVVTSPTGAAIRDIIHVLGRRFPCARVVLFPCRVQGKEATSEIVEAIRLADAFAPDVLIVGRGGGSLEDLWCFNEEAVARAIFSCRTPVVSAVGHEIDFTISDFVADVRAPTPSAAAELVVPSSTELSQKLRQIEAELTGGVTRGLENVRTQLRHLENALINPRRMIQDGVLKLEDLNRQLTDWMKRILEIKKEGLARQSQLLESLSPLAVLGRGYALATSEGRVLIDASQLGRGDLVHVRLARGEFDATVSSVDP